MSLTNEELENFRNEVKELSKEYRNKWREANYNYFKLEQISKFRILTELENADYLSYIKEATILVKIHLDLEELLK